MPDRYEIPFVAPDASSSLANLSNVFQKNRAAKQTDEELRLRAEKLKNDERRLNAEEFRKKQEFEQSQADRRNKAFLSALEFEKKGDYSTADAIRRAHGIESTPEMSAPTPYTPAMALAAANKPQSPQAPTGNPVKLEQSETREPTTPLNAFSRRDDEHAGTTVPEMQPSGYQGGGIDRFTDVQRQTAANNFDAIGAGAGEVPSDRMAPASMVASETRGGGAVEDLMAMTEDPRPTGAKTFTGPGGIFLGRFDPAEEQRFRAERAGRVSEALGPMGEKYAQIAAMIARGDIPEAEGKVLISTLASEAALREKEAGKDARQEDQQQHQAILAKLYRNEALTKEDIYALARMRIQAMVSASGGGPITPQEAELTTAAEQGAGLGEITTRAAAVGPAVNMKHLAPLVQNVVRNAATGDRASEKREGLVVNGLDGKPLGPAHTQVQANKLFGFTQEYAQAKVRLEELIHDIETNGPRIARMNPQQMVNEIQQRLSAAESVNAAMRKFNGLGATDASQQLEGRITGAIGTPGHGWLMGANLNVIKRILHEADLRFDSALKAGLRSGGGKPLAPSLGGPRAEPTNEDRKRALMDRLGL